MWTGPKITINTIDVILTCTSGGKVEAIFTTFVTFHPKYPRSTDAAAIFVARHSKRAIRIAGAS